MARYPTFEEYQKRGNYQDGIKRCDDLLKKNPKDVQLLTTKLQLHYGAGLDTESVLDQLLSIQPPIRDMREVVAIEEAVTDSQRDDFPPAQTAGPAISKLWDNAAKAFTATNHKLDLLSLRFSRAVIDNRLVDAQQALIQLKALQPKNRVFYMAHAAITQLLSTSKEDLQSRLALSLARKAVTEKFDEDTSLDCRVPGQIFAVQSSTADLESIMDRRFKESKQVFQALRTHRKAQINGAPTEVSSTVQIGTSPDWLRGEVQTLKDQFKSLIESSAPMKDVVAFSTTSTRSFHNALTKLREAKVRTYADLCFLSISSWIRAFELSNQTRYLLIAAFLGEILLKQDNHIYEARLILVYIYMRLNLGSLAIQHFDFLNIKEIQHDTLGHALFTRLSLIHPHETHWNKSDSLDPLKRTNHALKVYIRHGEKLAETAASVLNHEQTGIIFDLHELRRNLDSSVARRITYLEHRRISRLKKASPDDDIASLGLGVIAPWLATIDNRDFAGTFDYGYNVEKVLQSHGGDVPGKQWILHTLAVECVWCLANEVTPPVGDVEILVKELENTSLDLNGLHIDQRPSNIPGLSAAESLAGNLVLQLLKLLLNLTTNSEELPKNAKDAFKAFERLDVQALLESIDVFCEQLQDHFIYLDTFRTVVQASEFARKRTTDSTQLLESLRKAAQSHVDAIIGHAKEQADRTGVVNGVKAFLEEDSTVRGSLELFGESIVQDFSKSMALSAIEGWKGMAGIKPV